MQYDEATPATSCAPEVNQKTVTELSPPQLSRSKKLLIIVGIILAAVVLAVVTVWLIIAPKHIALTTLLHPDRPIILVRSKQLIALDPTNSTKQQLIYEIDTGNFQSAKWSPDGEKLAYIIKHQNCNASSLSVCEELGIMSLATKTPVTVYSQPNQYITYEWMNSSTLIYAVTKAINEVDFSQYDVDTKNSSLITAIPNNGILGAPFNVRGKNIYFHRSWGTQESYVGKFNLENPAKIVPVFNIDTFFDSFTISPDETYAVYIKDSQTVVFQQLDGTTGTKEVTGFNNLRLCTSDYIITADSRHVVICDGFFHQGIELRILDRAGNRISEINNDEITRLLPDPLPKANNSVIDFDISPDNKKLFFITQTSSDIQADKSLMIGYYAFLGDIDGKHITRLPFTGEGLKRKTQNDVVKNLITKNKSEDTIIGSAW